MKEVRGNLHIYILLTLVLATMFIWWSVFVFSESKLKVSFLDVGQGDAIFVEAPNGNQLLIDAGGNNAVLKELSKVMPFYDKSIDMVIATHPDKDHVGGFPEIFKRYKISTILESGATSNTGTFEAYNNLADKEGANRVIARRGMKIFLDENVIASVLFPDRDMSRTTNANDASVVVRLDYGKNSFFLSGDSPQAIEEYLVSLDSSSVDVDVLKAGHHGSRTSSSETLVSLATPQYAIISAGLNNSYGHPHKETMDLFERLKVPVLKTYESGTITFISDGINLRIK